MFRKSHFTVLAAGAAVAGLSLMSVGPVSANMITNGDFSANAAAFTAKPGYVSTNGNPTITGWTATQATAYLNNPGVYSSGINGVDTGFYGSSSYAPFAPTSMAGVNDFAFMQNGGSSVYQAATTTVGQAYTLTYDGAARAGETSDVLEVVLTDTTGSTQIATQLPAITDANFSQFTLNFTATSSSTEVQFLNDGPSSSSGAVDVSNVVMSAVPEPAALVLMGVGVLGLMTLKRRPAV